MKIVNGRQRDPVDWFVLTGDILALLSLPVILGVLQFFAPENLLSLLTYSTEGTTLHGLFGHWSVHYTIPHFLDNVKGYFLLAWMGYVLAWGIRERWWFRLSVLAILVVVPSISMVLSTWGFGAIEPGLTYTSRGASAVVAALLGLLYVLFLGFLNRIYDTRAMGSVGGTVLILVLTGLLWSLGSPSTGLLGVILGSAGTILLLDVSARLWKTGLSTVRWRYIGLTAVVGCGVAAVLLVFFVGLFPPDPFGGETITNVFSHAAGLVLGVLIAFWGHRYWTGNSWL